MRRTLWLLARLALLVSLLAGCVTNPVLPPAGENLSVDAADDFMESTIDDIAIDGQTMVITAPQKLAMRLDFAADLMRQPNLANHFDAADDEGIPARYAHDLGLLLFYRPEYRKAMFGPDLALLHDDQDDTTHRLWVLAAGVLARMPGKLGVDTLLDAAHFQLTEGVPDYYAQALIAQKDRIRADDELHWRIARVLVTREREAEGRGKTPPWAEALYGAFLDVDDLAHYWPRLADSAEDKRALARIAYDRLAALGDGPLPDPNALAKLRAALQDVDGGVSADASHLGEFFPGAHFDALARRPFDPHDQAAAFDLFLALRLLELGAPGTPPALRDAFLKTFAVKDYRPIAADRGAQASDPRRRLRASIDRYLAAEPSTAPAQRQWLLNVSLLMYGRPQDLRPYLAAVQRADRPLLVLAAAQVLGSRWDPGLYDLLAAHLATFKDAYDTSFYAQLMAGLSRAVDGRSATPFLQLQTALIAGGPAARAREILKWSFAPFAAGVKVDPDAVRALVEAAFGAGVGVDDKSVAFLVTQTPLNWLLQLALFEPGQPIPLTLVERALQARPAEVATVTDARVMPALLQAVATAPDARAIPAARVADLLVRGGGQARSKLAQAIQTRWLQATREVGHD